MSSSADCDIGPVMPLNKRKDDSQHQENCPPVLDRDEEKRVIPLGQNDDEATDIRSGVPVGIDPKSMLETCNEDHAVDDDWLVNQCVLGKTAHWNVLVNRYQGILLEKVSRMVTNPDDALEVVELTFFRASETISSFEKYQARVDSRPLVHIEGRKPNAFFHWLSKFAVELALIKARGGGEGNR